MLDNTYDETGADVEQSASEQDARYHERLVWDLRNATRSLRNMRGQRLTQDQRDDVRECINDLTMTLARQPETSLAKLSRAIDAVEGEIGLKGSSQQYRDMDEQLQRLAFLAGASV